MSRPQVPWERLARTACLDKLLEKKGDADRPLKFAASYVCRLHQEERCRYGHDCHHMHVCREFFQTRGDETAGEGDTPAGVPPATCVVVPPEHAAPSVVRFMATPPRTEAPEAREVRRPPTHAPPVPESEAQPVLAAPSGRIPAVGPREGRSPSPKAAPGSPSHVPPPAIGAQPRGAGPVGASGVAVPRSAEGVPLQRVDVRSGTLDMEVVPPATLAALRPAQRSPAPQPDATWGQAYHVPFTEEARPTDIDTRDPNVVLACALYPETYRDSLQDLRSCDGRCHPVILVKMAYL